MNRRILTLCKYLVITSIFSATTPVFSSVNNHQALKFKSNKPLPNLNRVPMIGLVIKYCCKNQYVN